MATSENLAAGGRGTKPFSRSPANVREKLLRVLWNIVWLLAFRFTPVKAAYAWRNFLLRLFGAEVGHALIYPSVRIFVPWRVKIGDWAAIGERVHLYGYGEITIGKKAIISQDSYLCTSSHDHTQLALPPTSAKIIIGEYSWLAARCFVLPGVTINTGSIVGACSVVTKDVPSWMIVAGNPAREVKERKVKERGPSSTIDGARESVE